MRDDPYADPALYDLEYEGLDEDIAFYLQQAARLGGPILELGVGNGRVALALANAGYAVQGVDLSQQMLDDLVEKLREAAPYIRSRVKVTRGDFRDLQLVGEWPTVFLPFNALHHCDDHRDVLGLFDGVRRLLAPGGRLVLDCYLPDVSLYQRDPSERYEERLFVHPRTGETLESWEQGWYEPLAQVHHVVYTYRWADGRERRAHLRLRMFWPRELRALIDWAGFDIESEWGGFDGEPLEAQSQKWVMVLVPRDPDRVRQAVTSP